MVITLAKLRMAHASTHGARKPPVPMYHCTTGNGKIMHTPDATIDTYYYIGKAQTWGLGDQLIGQWDYFQQCIQYLQGFTVFKPELCKYIQMCLYSFLLLCQGCFEIVGV